MPVVVIAIVCLVAGFVTGILVGKNNEKLVDAAVAKALAAAQTVSKKV